MAKDLDPIWLEAVAFAARAHHRQLRKDQRTPYVSHVFRVCLIVRNLFGFDDPHMLAAALLHDTIEDTTTDFDDLAEHFGPDIAVWVSLLTKNKSLPHDEREAVYGRALGEAPWQVQVCKLADIYDNLADSDHLPPQGKQRSLDNARRYLDAIKAGLKQPAVEAWQKVAEWYATKSNRARQAP
jgi:(p)ppGpp synthase/HD superfamily hydrolase